MSKLPAFQFYPGDWRKDMGVQSLSYHDRGVWWELLCLMHESERRGLLILNGHAMSEDAISRLLGLDKQILTTTITTLLTSGVATRDEETGALMSRRMVRDEKIREIRAEAGKKGGNPALLNQNPTTIDNHTVKQNPTPSSSSSVSSSVLKPNAADASEIDSAPKPEKKPATPKAKPQRTDIPSWLSVDAWEGFEDMRKKIRAPLTDHARELLIAKLDTWHKEGQDVAAALNQSTERGWRGVWPAEVTQKGNSLQEVGNGTSGISATKRRVNANRQAIAEAVKRRGWANTGGPDSADGRQVPEPGSERLA